jgi:hypothetical protein
VHNVHRRSQSGGRHRSRFAAWRGLRVGPLDFLHEQGWRGSVLEFLFWRRNYSDKR